MQTFLPVPDFKASAKILDFKRLGKQRVEAFQILNILENKTQKKGWRNHPATKMWKGYVPALRQYLREMILEWIDREFENNMQIPEDQGDFEYPKWFGNDELHASHRSNLLRKFPEFYGLLGWKETNNLPYYWPVK